MVASCEPENNDEDDDDYDVNDGDDEKWEWDCLFLSDTLYLLSFFNCRATVACCADAAVKVLVSSGTMITMVMTILIMMTIMMMFK